MYKRQSLGYVPPRTVLERALAEIDAQLPADLEAGPFYAPFKRLGRDIDEAERKRLQALGREAVQRDVLPAMRKLRAFVAGDYLAHAPAEGALLRYPDGARLYDELVRQQTTTHPVSYTHLLPVQSITGVSMATAPNR